MWQHLGNLCSAAWGNLVASLSTSNLSILIFSFVVPVLIFVATFIYNLVQARKSGVAMKEIVKTSAIPSFIAAIVIMIAWILLFSRNLVATIYKDHQDLVKQIPQLNPQCWMESVPLRVPRIPATVQSQSAALIVCNTDLKAPRTMTLHYDQNPTGYSFPIVEPEKTAHWGFGVFNDKSLTVSLTDGSISAEDVRVLVDCSGSRCSAL